MIKNNLHIIFNIFFKFPQQSSYNNCFFSDSTYLYAVIIYMWKRNLQIYTSGPLFMLLIDALSLHVWVIF